MPTEGIKYSVVVPVFNEEGNVTSLHKEITKVMAGLDKAFEIIFVDDGSQDNTIEIIKNLSPVKLIQLRKNSGQSVALDAGIKASRGEVIITLDGDGQNDPADIPRMLEELNNRGDVICGWRKRRQDTSTKKFVSFGARILRKILVDDGIHDAGCTLRVFKRECFEGLDLYGEMHRMIPALLKWRGFEVREVVVNHRKRGSGVTKYNWKRLVKGFLDMIGIWFWRRYESRPLHIFGGVGLALILGSLAGLMSLAIMRLFWGYRLSDKIWPLVGVTGFLAGIQLLVFGILADIIVKSRPNKEFYLIKSISENEVKK